MRVSVGLEAKCMPEHGDVIHDLRPAHDENLHLLVNHLIIVFECKIEFPLIPPLHLLDDFCIFFFKIPR